MSDETLTTASNVVIPFDNIADGTNNGDVMVWDTVQSTWVSAAVSVGLAGTPVFPNGNLLQHRCSLLISRMVL